MPRTISSAKTFLLKVVFAPLWIGGFAVATATMFLGLATEQGHPIDPQMKWFFLAVAVVGGLSVYRSCAPLKRVSLSDTDLHISNFRREIVVPLGDIEEVTQNRWMSGQPVTIRFRKRNEFGHAIRFMPKARMFALFSTHPVVAELRGAANRARGGLA